MNAKETTFRRRGLKLLREIELEVCAVPKSSVGAFLEGSPAPLSIGTVELEDGSKAHGFLVETTGVQGADDIPHLVGWHRYQEHQHQAVNAHAD